MAAIDVRDAVDQLLGQEKVLLGTPQWSDGPRTGQLKWKSPLGLRGEVLQSDLMVIAYPQQPTLTFMLMITYLDIAIGRIDYGDNEEHNNGWYVPEGITRWKIRGPHFHDWRSNKEFAGHAKLPETLKYAKVLPVAVRGFDNAFRWFCAEHRIACRTVPDYPRSERLL